MRPAAGALPLALLSGCVWGPGAPFVELVEVGLELQVEGEGRAAAQGARLALQALEGGGSFDPANPPEGYSLCHNGHCHKDDGTLPSYAQIEAELAGDAATWTDALETGAADAESGGGRADLLPGPRSLPVTEIGRALLRVDALQIEVDGELLELGPLALPADFRLRVDRLAPPRAALEVTLTADPGSPAGDTGDPGDTGGAGGGAPPARAEVRLVELP